MCHQQWAEVGGRVLAVQAKDPVFDLLAFQFPIICLVTYIKLKDVMTGKFAYLSIKRQQVIKVA